MGSGIHQADLGGAGEAKGQWLLAAQFDIIGTVLVYGTALGDGVVPVVVSGFDVEGGWVNLPVAVAPVGDVGVIQQVGDDPVSEEVLVGQPSAQFLQHGLHAGEGVFGVSNQRLGGLRAKAVEEIGGEKVPRAVVGPCRPWAFGPGVQLRIRLHSKCPVGATGIKVVQVHRQFGEALVQPGLFVAVVVPVDHVLELVSQHAVVEIVIDGHVFDVDVKHLQFVGIVAHGRDKFICAGVVAGDGAPQAAGVEDGNVGVVIHAGSPLGAEESTVGGIGVLLEQVCRSDQVVPVEAHPLLDPHVQVLGLVLQDSIDVELFVGVHVGGAEEAAGTGRIVGGALWIDGARDARRQAAQPNRQFVQVTHRHVGRLQQFLRLGSNVARRFAGNGGGGLGGGSVGV